VGKYTIPGATARIKNNEYQSNAVSLEIIAAQARPPQQEQDDQVRSGESSSIDDNSLFIRLLTDRTEVYIGELITATIKIYSQVNLSGIDQTFKGPDFTGFFTERLEVPPLRNLEREVYNGEIYYTGILRKVAIIPQQTGEIIIGPFDIDVSVRQEVRRRISDPFFDDFIFPDIQNVPLTLESKTVKIRVKPLPGNAPPSFAGAVGDFRLSSSLNKTVSATNEPLTLKYIITGTGNLKLMDEPVVNIPSGLEKYDPVINTNMNNPLSGIKTYEYLIVPQMPGTYTIEPAEFTYFNPSTGKYNTLFSESFRVNIEKGQWDTLSPVISGVIKEDVQLLNQDIQYIRTRPFRLVLNPTYFAGSSFYYVVMVVILLIFIVLLMIRERINLYNADTIQLRKRKADKYAGKRLKHCNELLLQEKYTEFYDMLLAALWRYLSDKLNIPLAILSKETAQENLSKLEVNREIVDEFFHITSECEMARYTPTADYSGAKQLYHHALDIISKIHQKLK